MNRKIFIADDDPRVIAAYKSLFDVEDDTLNFFAQTNQGPHYDVEYFCDGESLNAAFTQALLFGERVPLCILDMLMPGASGIEVAELLRRVDPDVQILIMTAYSDVSAKEVRDRLSNRVFFQRKPFHGDEILSQVETLLQVWNQQQILEQKNSELKLQEERLRLVLEGGELGFWDWKIPARKMVFNERWAAMLGYSLSEIDQSFEVWNELLHPDDREQANALVQAHLIGESDTFESVFRLKTRTGEWVWILSRGKVIDRDEHDKPLRMCGTHLDITQKVHQDDLHRQQSQRLEYQNQVLEGLLHSLNDVIFELDSQGTILHVWNENDQILAMPPGVFIDQTLDDVLGEEKASPFMDAIGCCLESQEPQTVEYSLSIAGEERWFSARFRPLGHGTRVLAQVDEITERRRQSDVLKQQNQQLTELNRELENKTEMLTDVSRAKAAFLATMSHEIRTPLNGVIGISDLLIATELSATQRDLVQILRASSESLLGIVNDILDFSKIEAGKMSLEVVPVSAKVIMHEVRGILNARAQEKGLTLIGDLDEDIGFLGDPTRIRQILLNFMSNAVKFTEMGRITLNIMRAEDLIRFEVRDTGVGLTEVQKQNLFQPYMQAELSTARKYGGTGLGLSICKALVDLMKGGIGVESEYGKGSCFWFEIPFVEANFESRQPEVKIDIDLKFAVKYPFKILVVDDNAVNRKVIGLMLYKLGYEVVFASDGATALVDQTSFDFDLVLMDMQMPELSGPETAQQWRANEQKIGAKSAVIIALTANASAEDKDICLAAGMDGFLSKPLKIERLAETLISYSK